MSDRPHSNRRALRYAVAGVALLCGLYFSVAGSERGFLVPSAPNLFATPELDEGEYDLQGLTILNSALLRVKNDYVEPERVDPQRMLVYALFALQDQIPQVVARFNADLDDAPTEVDLQVDEARRTFEIDGIESPWEMAFRLRDIFRFVQENLDDDEVDLREVEYAAINGMLDTLDPHSVLLSPDVFEDMQANNRGSFGGLGIVISIRNGQLTVISPIDGTPAHRAGLRSGDQILKIGEESTINMSIEEAVGRLRGDPGTPIEIEVMREGWTVPHEFNIVRERIAIESVKSHVLGDGIGYISISNFQANTHDDLVMHLGRLRDEMGGIRGLVLDLRDNPGGLLEQAIRVADTFLDDGTIVTTVGEGHRLRDEKKATEEGTEPFYPIVVLINPGSASASEIVAGALQNHGRAVIAGERSFGKGSVQVLYPFDDGSALKLTIAQYLTPGDISIQGVGIVPDIRILAMEASETTLDLYENDNIVREGDLEASLASDHVAPEREAAATVRYYRPPAPELDPDAIVDPDLFEPDFEIELAQRLLLDTGETWQAADFLAATTDVVSAAGAEQDVLVAEQLATLGIDWQSGANPATMSLAATVRTNRDDNQVAAGETVEITLEVTNTGSEPVHRLRAVSHSDHLVFDDREFIFGEIAPGGTQSWTVPVEVGVDEPTRVAEVVFDLRTDNEPTGASASDFFTVIGSERPHFAFAYQIIDDEGGNGDGLLQVDESVVFRFSVTNVGGGAADEMLVYLKNEVETAILLEHARETWEDGLGAGATRTAEFRFRVQHAPPDGSVRFEAAIYDTVFREFTKHDLVIPLQPDGDLNEAATGLVRSEGEALTVHGGADLSTPGIAQADGDDVLAVIGRLGDWTRVSWAEDRFGWVPSASVVAAEGEPATLEPLYALQPPIVSIDRGVLRTSDTSVRLSGLISDDTGLSDYYIWVTSAGLNVREEPDRLKVSYDRAAGESVTFDQEIPLFPGSNRITVIARDAEHMAGTGVAYVYRTSDTVLDRAFSEQGDRPAPPANP
jgi:carboxyl-terminal processing protease